MFLKTELNSFNVAEDFFPKNSPWGSFEGTNLIDPSKTSHFESQNWWFGSGSMFFHVSPFSRVFGYTVVWLVLGEIGKAIRNSSGDCKGLFDLDLFFW